MAASMSNALVECISQVPLAGADWEGTVLILDALTRKDVKEPISKLISFSCPFAGADWEGIVLIPFLDEARLLKASLLVKPESLAPEERARNKLGDILVFSYSPGGWWGLTQCGSTLLHAPRFSDLLSNVGILQLLR